MFTLFGHPRYAIYDCQLAQNRPAFFIESVSCRFCCTPCLFACLCPNREFRIVSQDTKEEVGTISRSLTCNADFEDSFELGDQQRQQQFGVQFAPNLEARYKVLLLSACFMMDFFYFEKDRRRRKLASC